MNQIAFIDCSRSGVLGYCSPEVTSQPSELLLLASRSSTSQKMHFWHLHWKSACWVGITEEKARQSFIDSTGVIVHTTNLQV